MTPYGTARNKKKVWLKRLNIRCRITLIHRFQPKEAKPNGMKRYDEYLSLLPINII